MPPNFTSMALVSSDRHNNRTASERILRRNTPLKRKVLKFSRDFTSTGAASAREKKLYPPASDCLRRSSSWRAALFTGRSRRATALVATRAAAVTTKAPSTGPTYTSATAGRVERLPAIMCLKLPRARCVAAWRPGSNCKLSCGSSPRSTKSARLKLLASKNRCALCNRL